MLNDKQREAVLNQDRFVFLYAGAGTGKTTVMIEKIKYLIKIGHAPESILGLTFTKEAALQMKQRLDNEHVSIETFHAFAYTNLKEIDLLSEDAPFSQSYKLAVSQYKNKYHTSRLPKRFRRYTTYLNTYNVIDYDDLLILAIKEKGFKKDFSYILIDEFQDTNILQMHLLLTLVSEHTHVFAVGDPDQSIYRFRGAVPDIVNTFIQLFQAKTLYLENNYRSYHYIIELANFLISHDKYRVKKYLNATQQLEGSLTYQVFKNTQEETTYIEKYMKDKKSNIAILCRTHRRLYEIKHMLFESFMFTSLKNIHILTMHQSKGLEFNHVIIVGLEEPTIPGNNIWNQASLNEERRLLFVAVTRAKKSILFTRVQSLGKPSQFLPELNLKP